MTTGNISQKVRPLRIAFLVDPSDKKGLYQAIELNSFLWGGSYNPIIPAYSRTPKTWDAHPIKRLPKPAEIVSGYLNAFDPDIVVPIGVCEKRSFNVGHRDIVLATDLIGDLSQHSSPAFGIGIIELLNDFIKSELKYQRLDNLKVIFPELPNQYKIFLASVFGVLPPAIQAIVDKNYLSTNIVKIKSALNDFIDLLKPNNMFPRRLSSWKLEEQSFKEPQLFLCDAKSTQDIIDYWNLRAAGNLIIPIPVQTIENANVIELCRNFIEENYYPSRFNSQMVNRPTIQRARSISEDKVKNFCEKLDMSKKDPATESKYVLRMWHPRIWSEWAHQFDAESVEFPYSYEKDQRIADQETNIEARSESPNLELSTYFSGKPRFVNEFSFRFYGSKEPMAEVIPEGSRELSSAIGRSGYSHWRFTKSGPVYMAHSSNELIFINLPDAESVMIEWFKERGWKVSLSVPGKIAKQLIKQLGGEYGISWLAHRGIIDLLSEISNEDGKPHQYVNKKLTEIIKTDQLYFSSDYFIEKLLEVKALRLGAKVQCPICSRHNWFEINTLGYELKCQFCLSEFQLPQQSPNLISWTYRAHGPFFGKNAQGAFTVLLTLRLLNDRFSLGNKVTPLLSYTANRNGHPALEADLTCLLKGSTRRDRGVNVVHVECKSNSRFEEKDIARMVTLSNSFPGSVLIFATLKNELLKVEIGLIKKLAISERRKRLNGKQHSPVIVLTGLELLAAHDFGTSWREKGGLHQELQNRYYSLSDLALLADATQQLYLELPSFDAEISEKMANKNKKKINVELKK